MAEAPITLTLPDRLTARLRRRGLAPVVIPRDLGRYYLLLDQPQGRVRTLFSPAEIDLIADAGGPDLWESYSLVHIPQAVADAIAADHLDAKHGVDGPALVAQLRGLTLVEIAALVDALERFWLRAWDAPLLGTGPRSLGRGWG